MKQIKDYIELIIAAIIFLIIIMTHSSFYDSIKLLLEFIVIVEVVQMIFVFIKRRRIKIRYMIDVSIIYSLRELLISITHQQIDYMRVSILLAIIFLLFILRYLSIKITYPQPLQN